MAGRLFKFLAADSVCSMQIRHKYSRGKPPTLARNLEQRIAEMEYKDPEIYYKVNIGFAVSKDAISRMRRALTQDTSARRRDPELAKLARRNQQNIDLEKATQVWQETNGPHHTHKIAEHYGIYEDLYGDGHFYPVVPLAIDYDYGSEELLARAHRGNIIAPSQAKAAPRVDYKADASSLWTLLMTTPDGNLSQPEMECCHWFVGNIPGNDVSNGEQIIDYMQPIPAKGIGYCRYIFVLYKQDKKIDFTEYKKEQPCLNLVERNFKTYDFMKKHQDHLTPAGLSFFQSSYEKSLKVFFHNTLDMEQPTFEYDFPAPHYKAQKWFPIKQSFNLYLDRYRDPKQINKEFLLKKLQKEHPFRFPEPKLKYPAAHPYTGGYNGYLPSWKKWEMQKERLGLGRVADFL